MKLFGNKFFKRAMSGTLAALLLVTGHGMIFSGTGSAGNGGGGRTRAVFAEEAAEENIALGKRAIACHTESSGLVPGNAVDGKTDTRYAAGSACPGETWLTVDLGGTFDISRVRINWEAAHPAEYLIEVSDDCRKYRTLGEVSDAETGWQETAVEGRGRFVRILELERTLQDFGMSIFELEIYGTKAEGMEEKEFYLVSADETAGGTVILSAEGFVEAGTEITVTAKPDGKNTVKKIVAGDETFSAGEGKAVFTVKGDTRVSAEFGILAGTRYEFEKATVLAADGKTKISVTPVADEDASGGITAGATGGKFFVFTNVAESNLISVDYATHNTSTMNIYIRYPDAEDYEFLCILPFSTSNSWYMSSSYTATAGPVYIPEGSDIYINPQVDVNLDCVNFTFETVSSSSNAPANAVTAEKMTKYATEDPMSPYGVSALLKAGESFTLTVPGEPGEANVFSITYSSETPVKLSLSRGGEKLGEIALEASRQRTFTGAGERLATVRAGEELTLSCEEGELYVAAVLFDYAQPAEIINIGKLPGNGERLTVVLNGIWDVDAAEGDIGAIPEQVPPLAFPNSICVPGLWHSAAYDLGKYASSRMWYRKTVTLEEEPTGQVLLNIGAAQYGRYVYVNGGFAGMYEYNYSPSSTDITGLLHKGDNEIVIMLGPWAYQQNNPDSVAHVLYDGESTEDEPGITDTVTLVFNAAPDITAVQTAQDIDEGAVTLKIMLKNRSSQDITTDVRVKFFELGTFTGGKPDSAEKAAGEYTEQGVTVKAGETLDLTLEGLKLTDWSAEKCWSVDRPYLYRAEIATSGDSYSLRFGMRTFDFDPETHWARLNGELIFLMGTNVAIERYFDDPLCGNTPWQEDWIRKLYSEYKDVGWFCFRTHLGHANSLWYDIADEMGFLIFDEYALWGNAGNDTIETILPEIFAWIDCRGSHPCLAVFDAQNEATFELTDQIIAAGRGYDIQQRPWDNGWRPPVGENDPIECHPYIIGRGISGLETMENKKPVVTTADIGWTADQFSDHPFVLNEHGEYWINREGAPMSGTAGTWNAVLPGAKNEARKVYYADLVTAQIEAFRAGRAYCGLLFFCGLGSSFPSALGVTSDILSPDVSSAETLEIRPYIKELLKNTYAKLGIVIDTYTEMRVPGEKVSVPVVLVNDTGKDISDLPVTIVVKSGDKVLYADRANMSVSAFSVNSNGTSTHTFEFRIPSYVVYCDPYSVLTVEAYYTLDGETVFSRRKWTMDYCSTLTDGPVPEFEWLNDPNAEAPAVRGNAGKTAGIICGCAAAAAAAAAIAVTVGKKKKGKGKSAKEN